MLEETLQAAVGAFDFGLCRHLAADMAWIDRPNTGYANHRKAKCFKAVIA